MPGRRDSSIPIRRLADSGLQNDKKLDIYQYANIGNPQNFQKNRNLKLDELEIIDKYREHSELVSREAKVSFHIFLQKFFQIRLKNPVSLSTQPGIFQLAGIKPAINRPFVDLQGFGDFFNCIYISFAEHLAIMPIRESARMMRIANVPFPPCIIC
jgi:hypothetical protein